MRRRISLSALLAASALVVGPLGCTGSSWCADCDASSKILGLNYQPSNTYTVGTPIAVNPPNPQGGTPVTYSVTVGALPAGLTLSPTTGHITGTPTAPGVYTLTIQGANAANVATQTLSITVLPNVPLAVGYATPMVFPATSPIAPQPASLAQATPGITTTYELATGALPAGLTLDATTGNIAGTPTTPGVYGFSVRATNGTRTANTSADYTVTPAGSLALNYATPQTFPSGSAIAAQAPTLANVTPGVATTFALTSGSLPAGLTLNADGRISGTPTTPGVYPFTVMATNGTRSATSSPTYTVTPAAALSLNYATPMEFTEGTVIAAQSPSLGNATPGVATTYALTGGALPAGLTLNPSTGAITGTPTTPGVFAFTVAATNGTRSAAASATYTVVPAAALSLGYATPQTFTAGSAIFLQTPTVANATPGVPTTFALTSGSLPAGLTLNADGTISGTPTAPGVYTFTVTATNGSRTATATPTYTVTPAAALGLSYVTPRFFPQGAAIASQPATVSNATPGLSTTFAVTAGSLPAGLGLAAGTGAITGTPTTPGVSTFTVTATNGTRIATANVSYTVVNPAPTALNYATPVTYTSGFAITPNNPNPSGGTPTGYAITGGSLPAGLSLDPSTGVISGTPTASGSFSVTITGSNASGSASQTVAITVLAPLTANLTANPSTIPVNQSSSLTSIFSGGTGAIDQGLGTASTGGSLPVGPYATPGSYPYTLTVTNAAGASLTSTATITVTAAPPNSVTIPVPTTGTTYTNSTPGPLNGLSVVVPNQGSAVCAATDLTITRNVGAALPGALAGGASAASDPWTLSSTVGYPFRLPMTVTLPYDGTGLAASDVPVPFYWDPAYGKWVAVGLKKLDTTNHLITFTTLLPGQYAVLVIPGLSASLADQSLGFTPGTDGWFQPNQGTFNAPGGSSFGMSSFASWYFGMRKATFGNAGLSTLFREGDANSSADDVSARALISRLANGTQETWNSLWSQNAYQLSGVQTGLALITGLRVTGQPQIFLMGEARPAVDNAIAAVVTSYTQATGKFGVLDPNYPGMPLTITWNAGTGAFTSYDRAAGYVPTFTQYAMEGQPSIHRLADYERVLTGATGGWATPPFATLTVSDVAGTGSVASGALATVPSASNVTITGSIANGSDAATHVFWSQNGGARTPVALSGNNFSFTIPALLDPYGTRIALETTANPCDPTFSFTGYMEFNAKEAGRTAWFPNICFESGSTSPWVLEQGSNASIGYPASPTFSGSTGAMNGYGVTWSGGSIDSALVSVANDANVASISQVFDGSTAFRVNNPATGAHISRIYQSLTVPTDVDTPKLAFYWAAVMQDPGHSPADQPYVDILVQDVTNGYETIYFKHFYANDPSYPGWVAGSSIWKGINWQKVGLSNLTARKGHVLKITVTAADCTQTGHAGYAYLDGVNCN
ncbi:MAG: putative Ig domain-containing protein [Acidobacteria bacterium]|nr:putative Ig domain-containing protein [Acidobacteriota bacterium]